MAKRICEQEPCALYAHCYEHCINLAAGDAIKYTKMLKNVMEPAMRLLN